MSQVVATALPQQQARTGTKVAAVAWVFAALFYFLQYVARSAPSVMIPQLSEGFNLTAIGVASLVGIFYYGYSIFSLASGPALDRFGPRVLLPIGAVILCAGALLFATGNATSAGVGRFLQ